MEVVENCAGIAMWVFLIVFVTYRVASGVLYAYRKRNVEKLVIPLLIAIVLAAGARIIVRQFVDMAAHVSLVEAVGGTVAGAALGVLGGWSGDRRSEGAAPT